ncbi:uncharacterized protein BT62DRAFT_514619 [Guyanagaster necrorhizus]|uniref:C2H2-type domain-containing protein n=1 Tax=Guyanagaster necrorhizus TaxID=856835 RepID=A0A9P7W1J5_9AGAR|nr:uncharacterized protein BT62DRAFT_514619 [Guyanagaster necrorhizus MCA 3950]KAG7450477.1 hypothetical protein BT62DRAFT_514619 [Guyanagaster necrorhizus MCA 3950]
MNPHLLSLCNWDQRTILPTVQRDLSHSGSPTLVCTDDETEVEDPPAPLKKKASRGRSARSVKRDFLRPSSLTVHIRTHSGDKPYQCPFPGCERDFNVKSNMHRHLKKHSTTDTFNPSTYVPPESKGRFASSFDPSHIAVNMILNVKVSLWLASR